MGQSFHFEHPPTEQQIRVAHSRAPMYVQACNACAWHLRVWQKDTPNDVRTLPYRCCSWRHEGECRLRKGAQDFERIREGLEKYDYWCHVVLTFARPVGVSPQDMYIAGKDQWAALRKRWQRADLCKKYVQTWEQHKKGFPHVHLAIMSDKLFESCVADKVSDWKKLLQADAVACGFGKIGSVNRLYGKAGMAGYLTKLAKELTGTGEKGQIPIDAPPHFRRLRASQGLLPPVQKNPDMTGILEMCRAP